MSALECWWNDLDNNYKLLLFKNFKIYLELQVKRKYKFRYTESVNDTFNHYFEDYKINLQNLDKETLTQISKLPILNLINSNIETLNFLYSTKYLKELYLDNCPIRNIDFLKHFKNLRKLSLVNIYLDSWPYSFEDLIELRNIDLTGSNATHIHFLSNNLKLKELYFHNTEIQRLFGVEKLTDLLKVGMNQTPIENLWPLANCTKLQEITCGGSYITELFPLNRLLDLRIVNLSGTEVRSLESLFGLTKLHLVICSDTFVPEEQYKSIKWFNNKCSINPDYKLLRENHRKSLEETDFLKKMQTLDDEELKILRKELKNSK